VAGPVRTPGSHVIISALSISIQIIMPTVVANEDGSYTITVLAPVAPVNTVSPEVTEVDLVLTDGSTKKFVAA
jgi:hypothetical protein